MVTPELVLLSVQRALNGAVPGTLRAVTCGWSDDAIFLRFIFSGAIDEDDREGMSIVASEVAADFQSPIKVEDEIIRADYPEGLESYRLQAWAYMRKERSSSGVPLSFPRICK